MRRLLPLTLTVFLLGPAVPAADPPKDKAKEAAKEPPKDTFAAAHTRTKKLAAKVTLDVKNQPLKDVFEEISGQLQDQKLGPISVHYAQGVSMNTRVSFAGKNVTAEDALDGILKQLDLGYVVVSKDKDRYDGWLEVVKGPNRGYPDGVGPKPGAKKPADGKKDDAKKADDKPDGEKKAEKPTAEDERLARIKLDLAKSLQEDGKADRAKVQLKFIVKHYPDTKAGGEAKELLEKLGK